MTRPITERFWEKVDKSSECWLWTGSQMSSGYGRISVNGRVIGAHRLSFELHFKEIPTGLYVCHKCDNRLCVRPDHLFLGTQTDNLKDMVSKSRNKRCRGEQHHSAKLSQRQVIAIRIITQFGSIPYRQVAKIFGVSQPLVSRIISRKSWSWLGSEK